jgi:hypothetical protein
VGIPTSLPIPGPALIYIMVMVVVPLELDKASGESRRFEREDSHEPCAGGVVPKQLSLCCSGEQHAVLGLAHELGARTQLVAYMEHPIQIF